MKVPIKCKFCGADWLATRTMRIQKTQYCGDCAKAKVWMDTRAARVRAKELGIDIKNWRRSHFYVI